MLRMPDGYSYWYIDDKTEKWCIKEDAPEWAKKEFQGYADLLASEPDEKGVIIRY